MLLRFLSQALLVHPHFMSLSCSGEDQIPQKSYCENALRWNTSQMRKLNFVVSSSHRTHKMLFSRGRKGKAGALAHSHGIWFLAKQQQVVSAEAQTCQLSNKTWVISLRRWLSPADSHCWTQQWSNVSSRNEPQATGAINYMDPWPQRECSSSVL